MTKLSIQTLRRAGAAAIVAAVVVPTSLFAQSTDAALASRQGKIVYSTQLPAPSRAVCEQAKRDAWFLRQMQLTDGDHDPRLELPIREDCVAFFTAEKAKRDAVRSVAQAGARVDPD